MNKIKLCFILLIASVSFFSCNKDDKDTVAPPRDRAQQYTQDIADIEEYLKSHYITKVMVDGVEDVQFLPITDPATQVSIWDNTEFPLKYKMVKNDVRKNNNVNGVSGDKVDYKLYYLLINEGGGEKPNTVDSTFTTYKGWTLDNNVFDSTNTPFWSTYPVTSTGEVALISGYRQFLPELKTSISSTVGDDGYVTFENPGMGVVFIPSGLGYFDVPKANIPSYSPLIFRIRLQSVRYKDHDRDGILSKDENYDGDYDFFNDDTDGDNLPDFLDIDDDGDGYTTNFEIKENGVIVKPYPACDTGNPKYKDKSCHPPKATN